VNIASNKYLLTPEIDGTKKEKPNTKPKRNHLCRWDSTLSEQRSGLSCHGKTHMKRFVSVLSGFSFESGASACLRNTTEEQPTKATARREGVIWLFLILVSDLARSHGGKVSYQRGALVAVGGLGYVCPIEPAAEENKKLRCCVFCEFLRDGTNLYLDRAKVEQVSRRR